MARLCARCRQPVDRDARDHDCPEDDEGGLISLDPPAPVPYDGPVHDADDAA